MPRFLRSNFSDKTIIKISRARSELSPPRTYFSVTPFTATTRRSTLTHDKTKFMPEQFARAEESYAKGAQIPSESRASVEIAATTKPEKDAEKATERNRKNDLTRPGNATLFPSTATPADPPARSKRRQKIFTGCGRWGLSGSDTTDGWGSTGLPWKRSGPDYLDLYDVTFWPSLQGWTHRERERERERKRDTIVTLPLSTTSMNRDLGGWSSPPGVREAENLTPSAFTRKTTRAAVPRLSPGIETKRIGRVLHSFHQRGMGLGVVSLVGNANHGGSITLLRRNLQ